MPLPEKKFAAAWSRWFRRNFTRDSVLDFVKTVIWVAPLSVLIWIYADQNTSTEEPRQPIGFEIVLNDPSRVVNVMIPERTVVAKIKASRSRLKAVQDELRTKVIRIELKKDAPFGTQNYDLTQAIQNAPLFQEYGVSVSNLMPATVPIEIDRLEKVTVPVVPPDDATNLVRAPIFEPREVTLTAPSEAIKRARQSGQTLQAIADFSQNVELRQPGTHEGVVPIRASVYGEHIVLDKATVTVAMEIKANDKQHTLRYVPVRIMGSKAYLDEVTVECNDTLSNIRVYGPADQIDRLTSSDPNTRFDYYAVLTIDSVDTSTSKPLSFHLPPGVNVNPEDAQKPFEYRVVKRTAH
jgi:hypothetical protein